MAKLLTLGGQTLADEWQILADEDALPASGCIIVSLARWNQDKDSLQAYPDEFGIELPNTLDVQTLPTEVLQAPLIALRFPAFADGRAYSQARLLRERLNYNGVIRACGDVLHDQLFYMARCGFDQFEWPQNLEEDTLARALGTFTTAYQPTRSGPQVGDTGIIKSGA